MIPLPTATEKSAGDVTGARGELIVQISAEKENVPAAVTVNLFHSRVVSNIAVSSKCLKTVFFFFFSCYDKLENSKRLNSVRGKRGELKIVCI